MRDAWVAQGAREPRETPEAAFFPMRLREQWA